MHQYIISLKIVTLLLCATVTAFAQNKSTSLKTIWENNKNADTIRFKALAEYYKLNNQAEPDTTLTVLGYYYELAKETNNTKELYNVANDRGGIFRLKGQNDSAFNYYNEAEKLAQKLNDSVLIAANLGNKGNVYAAKNDYKNALQHFSSALKIYKSIKDIEGESHMLTSIGSVYLYIENFDLAIQYYEKALTIVKNVDVPPRRLAVNYINTGWANYELKKYEAAKTSYQKALKILEVTNDKFFLVSCYATLAKIHLALNHIQEANAYAVKNKALSTELNKVDFITEAQIIIAQLDLKKGNIKDAKVNAESILKSLDKNTSNELKSDLYDVLYKIYQAENNPVKSLEMYQQYSNYKDSVQQERNQLSLIREVVKNEFGDLLTKNEQALKSKQQQKILGIILLSIMSIGGIVFYYNRNLKRDRKKRDELLQEIENLKRYGTLNLATFEKNENRKSIETDAPVVAEVVQEHQDNPIENLTQNTEVEKPTSAESQTIEENTENEKLNSDELNNLAVNADDFQLVKEKIEKAINRKLNPTDWNVLNILLKEPDISNKEIAEKAFMSVDGIGSSLRRMYMYFDIKETKYKKIALIMEAIKASKA
jgi:tetratricopeptide (TPR) repeat protein